VPFAAICAVSAWLNLDIPVLPAATHGKQNLRRVQVSGREKFDFFCGFVLLALSVGCLSVGLSFAGDRIPWNKPKVYAPLVASAVATPIFGLHQVRISRMPFFRLRQLAKGPIMAIFTADLLKDGAVSGVSVPSLSIAAYTAH